MPDSAATPKPAPSPHRKDLVLSTLGDAGEAILMHPPWRSKS